MSLELAEIFGGEIDFNTDLQPGDTFGLAFEKVFREGRFSAYGPVLAAEFINDGRRLRAIRFTLPGGKPGYYDEQGRSLRRFFLASPLKFIRASRQLAVLHGALSPDSQESTGLISAWTTRPRWGRLSSLLPREAWCRPGGAGGWPRRSAFAMRADTRRYYMHLSSISVRAGQHVGQGEMIGRVGTTGMSTGPHLDYRVRKDGRA